MRTTQNKPIHPGSEPIARVATGKTIKSPAALIGVAVLLFAVGLGLALFALEIVGSVAAFLVIVLTGAAVIFFIACKASTRAFSQLRQNLKTGTGKQAAVSALTFLVALLMAGLGIMSALVGAASQFTRGRQLYRKGKILLPPLAENSDWNTTPKQSGVEKNLAEALAAQWRENGRTEHASVAAFARLTLDLMALGAPPKLIADANRDAIDEIEHTGMCFSLAHSLDGKNIGPGPFPDAGVARTLPKTRTLALGKLAVDSMIDGALHEGVSARIISQLSRRCEHLETKAVLKTIAEDEWRHAKHGWDVVEWCVQEGGSPIIAALKGAIMAQPLTMKSPLPEAAVDGNWEKHGIHGHQLECEQYTKSLEDLRRRVDGLGMEKAASSGTSRVAGVGK